VREISSPFLLTFKSLNDMAINKKLIHFKNKENFENEVANDNILDASIVFI
jgi:hypothetical protein